MLILPADADEAVVGAVVDRITRTVSARGGEIGAVDRWGRRRFAYEIAHQTEGYYLVVRFTAEPSAQAELERTLREPYTARCGSRQGGELTWRTTTR
jgi:small subunit ribosomal protein S6